MKPEIEPFRQGQLDGLCGVYAIVNAMRLAAQDKPIRLVRSDWEQLFYTILSDLDASTGGIFHAIMNGMLPKRFHGATKSAIRYMRDEHGLEVTIDRMFGKHKRPTIDEAVAKIHQATGASQPVIADFSGRLNHWSVIRRVTEKSLLLFDSAGHRHVGIDLCCVPMNGEIRRGGHNLSQLSLYRLAF